MSKVKVGVRVFAGLAYWLALFVSKAYFCESVI
jgi:hypothetical protein